MYGYQIAPKNDRYVRIAEQAVIILGEVAFTGAYLVNVFPWLQNFPAWFPGTGFKRLTAICKKLTDEMQDAPFDYVRQKMVRLTNS